MNSHSVSNSKAKKQFLRAVSLLLAVLFLFTGIRAAAAEGDDFSVTSDQNGFDVPEGVYTSLDELAGKKIAIQTGTIYDEVTLARIPDAKLVYLNSTGDIIASLQTGKVDGFPADEPFIVMLMEEQDDITMIPEYLDTCEFGIVFSKDERGAELESQMSAYINKITENGQLEALKDVWFSMARDEHEVPALSSLSSENGTLKVATYAGNPPFMYIRGDEIVGFEMELIYRFCEEYGYGLELKDMSFDALLPDVVTGKSDMAICSVSITEERAQSVRFSVPYYYTGTVMAVMKEAEDTSFWGKIRTSFEKTFIREGRWKLFAKGLLNTMIITVLACLFGTVLGFVLFMICRNGNKIANAITGFCFWIVQGMPLVVLMMILYYIVFVSISGLWVAVIGFTLTFGSAVFSMLNTAVGAIDKGQYEASYALGYNNRRTFFRIILPQSLPYFLPPYQGELVSLIKATAIVGYVSVQDLTRIADIVRSRTYEPFFPLIAITVIYFLLEGLLAFLVGRIRITTDPKKRKKEKILKGIETDK